MQRRDLFLFAMASAAAIGTPCAAVPPAPKDIDDDLLSALETVVTPLGYTVISLPKGRKAFINTDDDRTVQFLLLLEAQAAVKSNQRQGESFAPGQWYLDKGVNVFENYTTATAETDALLVYRLMPIKES